jgi:hypothetical protein
LTVATLVLVKEAYVGYHIPWVIKNHPAAVTMNFKLRVPYPVLYLLSCAFPKFSILGLYLRIFVDQRDRLITYMLIAILSGWCVSVIITDLFQCIPLAYLWNPAAYPNGHCINIAKTWTWASFPNTITDIMMLILPLPCILKLRLSKNDKIGLVITFATASM